MHSEQQEIPGKFTSTYHASSQQDIADSLPEVASGAHWFWWIAGLSLINTVMTYTGSTTHFIAGLGLTQMVDSLFHQAKIVAVLINTGVIAFFIAMGWLGAKGHMWAFWAGTLVYFIDAALFMYANEWMPVLFHGFALFYILKSAYVLHQALQPISPDV